MRQDGLALYQIVSQNLLTGAVTNWDRGWPIGCLPHQAQLGGKKPKTDRCNASLYKLV